MVVADMVIKPTGDDTASSSSARLVIAAAVAAAVASMRRATASAAGLDRLEERPALVLAEDVAHRVADLADRGVGGERVADRVEQVAVAAGDVA